MRNELLSLGIFIISTTLYTVLWGKTIDILVKSKLVTKFAKFIMNYSRMKLDQIKFYIIWFGYLFMSLFGTILFSLVYKINLFNIINVNNFKYIAIFSLIGFIVQLSASSMILTVISLIKRDINWYKVISDINWVKFGNKLPKALKPLYPLSGAFFEEIYFRGCIFLILITKFNFLGITGALIIVAMLFIIQQVINTQSFYQAVSMSIGALCISIVGCILILATGSFLPALICHELYVLFYLRN